MIDPLEFSLESIELKDITVGYPGSEPILKNASVHLPSQGVVQVKSHGGKGKSTVLRLLAGLVQAAEGEYILNGFKINDLSFEEFLPFRLRIGYSFDLGGLLSNKTLRENLVLPILYHKWLPPHNAEERVMELVKYFDLDESKDRRPSSVTGSQRKATCIARAFVMRPKILILDDPTTGLNPKIIKVLNNLIQEGLLRGELQLAIIASEDHRLIDGLNPYELDIHEQKLTLKDRQEVKKVVGL